jgi:hypothetical protein
MSSHTVRIHIDRQERESPEETTGAALYMLGAVPHDHELFREETGDHEDELVARNDAAIRVIQDEHFYSQRETKIIVNGKEKETPKRVLTFDELVHLAFEKPPSGPNVLFTITYRNGPHKNPAGTLTEGHSVFIKNKMVFNVRHTDKS